MTELQFNPKANLMLISLTLRTFNTARKDKQATREVIMNKHVTSPDAVRLIKDIINPESLKPYKRCRDMLRQWFYEQTLDYPIKGWRVQTNRKFPEFVEELRRGIALLNRAADEFTSEYPQYVKQAERTLGDLHDPHLYPAAGSVRQKFGAKFHVAPFPDGENLVVNLVNTQLNAAKNSVDELQREAVKLAQKDIYTRLADKLIHMSSRLSDPDNMFHRSMMKKFEELIDMIPDFNVFGDKDLNDLRNLAKKEICGYDTEDLRGNDAIRTHVKETADNILAKMGILPPAA